MWIDAGTYDGVTFNADWLKNSVVKLPTQLIHNNTHYIKNMLLCFIEIYL